MFDLHNRSFDDDVDEDAKALCIWLDNNVDMVLLSLLYDWKPPLALLKGCGDCGAERLELITM